MAAELKPCPFCGGNAAFVPRAVNLALQKDPSDPKFGVSVICGKCGSESPNMVDEEHAASAWNRRDAETLASRYALALNKIATQDCCAEQIAYGALLGTPDEPPANGVPAVAPVADADLAALEKWIAEGGADRAVFFPRDASYLGEVIKRLIPEVRAARGVQASFYQVVDPQSPMDSESEG